MKQKFIDAYMDTPERFAKLSYAKRLNVGAIVVKDDFIISYWIQWNAYGWDNDCEEVIGQDEVGSLILKSKPEVLHAESNAIAKLAKSNESGNDATLFVTPSPFRLCKTNIPLWHYLVVYFKDNYLVVTME